MMLESEMRNDLRAVPGRGWVPASWFVSVALVCSLCSGCALFVGSNILKAPTIAITANPASIATGQTAILTVTATDATQITITGSDGSTFNLGASGGVQSVKPPATTTYTAVATNSKGT